MVCARDRETLEEAKKLVKVAYEVPPAVHDRSEAAAPDAPLVFEEEESNVRRISTSHGAMPRRHPPLKYVLTRHFHPVDGARLSGAGCCVALPLENGGVKLLTTDQSSPHHHARVRLHAGSGL